MGWGNERMMPKEDAERYLASTAFSKVDLAETELMRAIYVHEDDKITDLEKRVLDVTKANLAVLWPCSATPRCW